MKYIEFAGYKWKLITKNEDKREAGGTFDWKTKTITINDRWGEGQMILLHELIEAILVKNLVRYYGNEGNQEYKFIFNHTEFSKIVQDIYEVLKNNNLLK